MKSIPEDDPCRAGILNSLGVCLSERYIQTKNIQNLKAAIATFEAALQAIPENHPDRARMLGNIGIMLLDQYEQTGNILDLEAAMSRSEEAVKSAPEDHPDQAMVLSNLGVILIKRCIRTANMQDAEAAIASYLSSWSIISAPIFIRISAAFTAGKLLAFGPFVNGVSRACSLLQNAINLLPLLTLRSLDREDQQHSLAELTGLASLAASLILEAGGSPTEALRLLELGRSVTNGQLLEYRSDISQLQEHHPALAEDFGSLRKELDSPIPTLDSSRLSHTQYRHTQRSAVNRRNMVAGDLDRVLLQIREKPGFENFLCADSEEYLVSAAQEGPIAILNVTQLRSDAILVTKTGVTSIELFDLSYDSMNTYCGTIASTLDNELRREFLEWLWRGAVQPVLRLLGFYVNPRPKESDPLPRIWWIGVGQMAKAPIHAAAKFKKHQVRHTTLHYCIPSYTSTIRALQYSRSRKSQCQQNPSALIVTMPTTPGKGSLSGVTAEAAVIKFSLRNSMVEILEQPSAVHVLQVLSSYGIAHFACHGVSQTNPADSHLLLLKQRKQLKDLTDKIDQVDAIDKLRVKDIAALNLPGARLAYLSACNTAQSTSSSLLDEITHIVSSFHIAGFVNVIGTLWVSEDKACHKMAADFYSALGKTDDVALSYHTAIVGLMKEKPAQPTYWAPFIHFGA